MMHAAKVALSFDVAALRDLSLTPHRRYAKIQRYARKLSGDPCASLTLTVENSEALLSLLPPAVLALEKPFVFMLDLIAEDYANPILPAHTDLNKTCGINMYLETNGEVTKFYSWDKETKQAIQTEQFNAEAGDCWLMDTTVPHSVDLVRNKRRRLLTFSFVKTPYKTVLEAL